MIFYWLADFFATSLLPEVAAMIPVCTCAELADRTVSATRTVMGSGADLSAWVPWDVLGWLVPIAVCVILCAILIRCIRMTISGFTGGGGSAA